MQKDTQPSQTCSGENIIPNPTQNRCWWCLFALCLWGVFQRRAWAFWRAINGLWRAKPTLTGAAAGDDRAGSRAEELRGVPLEEPSPLKYCPGEDPRPKRAAFAGDSLAYLKEGK